MLPYCHSFPMTVHCWKSLNRYKQQKISVQRFSPFHFIWDTLLDTDISSQWNHKRHCESLGVQCKLSVKNRYLYFNGSSNLKCIQGSFSAHGNLFYQGHRTFLPSPHYSPSLRNAAPGKRKTYRNGKLEVCSRKGEWAEMTHTLLFVENLVWMQLKT